MSTVKFTADHEWVQVTGTTARVGITQYAQEQLGDVVFVELPAVGATFAQGKEAAVVESVKAASDIYAPVSGTIAAVNTALPDNPSLVNSDPQGEGWFFEITLSNPSELDGLMDEAAYQAHIGA
ncbi:glycine cleavage system protein H [Elstera litoralis]|uniref:Glycine cleavage system H protein n=1 Tax=Elstera litoralis TaxID=552518 RepID=A0A0F3IUS3_9PROT|nr:glycine cleavage system protein GcvH [Elstera litoralis]KJV10495.1 glycine cleavage system protein H [Elstera litoralis]